MREVADVLILGGGLSGLAVASQLGNRAIVLEQDSRPGGLVKTEQFDGYWFDHVLHLLYFQDKTTERRIQQLIGDVLSPCASEAWVETLEGTVRFPFQMNLGGLKTESIVGCITDLAKNTFIPNNEDRPGNFEETLLSTFGQSMCDIFLFPYNRKMYKRPLKSLAPSGFTWNITRPDFEKVLHGALGRSESFKPYNSVGWYPLPPHNAQFRGMEVLAVSLSKKVADIRYKHRVTAIDPDLRTVTTSSGKRKIEYSYRNKICCSLPLPYIIEIVSSVPDELKQACRKLDRNRVLSATYNIKGPRPEGRGHWRYYADERLMFTRLIYPHNFDKYSAPTNGWGLMAEITQPGDSLLQPEEEILEQCRRDIVKVGALPKDCEIIGQNLMLVDPAYVVFTLESEEIIQAAHKFLRANDMEPIGRYGRWEYSSMAQVMRDGFEWADKYLQSIAVMK